MHVEKPKAYGIALRRAEVADAQTITGHRCAMFRDMGYNDEAGLLSMSKKFLPWVEAKLKSGEYLGCLAITEDDLVVGGSGLWLMDWPPHMVGASSRRGNIVNVYTEPLFRRRGLARWLTEATLHWCKGQGIDFVILHASDEGRTLYEELGFQAGNEMRKKI